MVIEHSLDDVIFMDWHLPDLDGLEATKQICAREH